MEVCDPGLLGKAVRFRERFAVPIERDGDDEAAGTLCRISGPFMLRRLKTDRSIIADLPEKVEMKVYCNLTREQAALYQAVVDDMMAKVESSEGIPHPRRRERDHRGAPTGPGGVVRAGPRGRADASRAAGTGDGRGGRERDLPWRPHPRSAAPARPDVGVVGPLSGRLAQSHRGSPRMVDRPGPTRARMAWSSDHSST